MPGCPQPWWQWYYYLNPVAYTVWGVSASQLGDVASPMELQAGGTAPVGMYLRDRFGFAPAFDGWIVLILIAFAAVFRAAAIMGLIKWVYPPVPQYTST